MSLVVVLAMLVSTSGCIQQFTLQEEGVVKGRIETVPSGGRKTGIRVNVVGTTKNHTPATSDYDYCDTEGDFAVTTSRLGKGWIVARGKYYDIGYGRYELKEGGDTASVSRLIPSTGGVELFEKKSGEALFVAFEEDFGKVTSIHLVGSFNGFKLAGARALHDDGSLFDIDPDTPGMQVSGDYAAGDGVWTLRTTLPSGYQQYGFMINRDESKIYRDPYEESSSSGHSVIYVK